MKDCNMYIAGISERRRAWGSFKSRIKMWGLLSAEENLQLVI
jgi:hypothetical protein